jgi:uncharacterized repeat protein (TIGR03803 family)
MATTRRGHAASWLITSVLLLASASARAQTYQLVAAFRSQGQPQAGLVRTVDGNLYGTTYAGGASGVGTIFRIDGSGVYTVVHNFAYADGANPGAPTRAPLLR